MRIYAHIADGFLDDFESVREFADSADYRTYRSEVDGIEYPLICPVTQSISEAVQGAVELALGTAITVRHVFLRASPAGVYVPNQVHNDLSMGQYSLMLYLNRPEDCRGGTSFLRHVEHGLEHGPRTQEEIAIAQRDSNIPERWEVTMLCPMLTNRALIFPAEIMHRAEPSGGFGAGLVARVVLTAFFDLRND